MRFLPLLSSVQAPGAWNSFPDVELVWDEGLHPGWAGSGIAIHALHLRAQPWGEKLVLAGIEALRPSLGADFLVIPAEAPGNLGESSRFLGALEALLEALAGRGVKIALRPAPGAASPLAALLKEVRCDAVGYCWDPAIGSDLEAISDRLFCAVGSAGDDYSFLRRLGYRWNMAIPGTDPGPTAATLARLEESHPMIYFPQEMP